MKKYCSIILLPIVALLMGGCAHQQEGEDLPDEAKQLKDYVDGLDFVKNYADRFDDKLDDSECTIVKENTNTTLRSKVVSYKHASSVLDDELYVNNDIKQYSYTYDETQINTNYHYDYVSSEYFKTTDKKKDETTEKTRNYKNISYYESGNKVYIFYTETENYHDVSKINLSEYGKDDLDTYLDKKEDSAYRNTLTNTLNFTDCYRVEGGYVGVDEYYSFEYSYLNAYQLITEIDEHYHIKKVIYIEKTADDYNPDTGEYSCFRLERTYYEVTYGNREKNNESIRYVESLFDKPYPRYAGLAFEKLSKVDHTNTYKSYNDLQKSHIEAYVYFDKFVAEDINVTPKIAVDSYPSLYEFNTHTQYITEQLEIKNPDSLHYNEENELFFTMDSNLQAIYFVVDTILERGELKLVKGTIEIRNKNEIVDYFDNLDFN